jgi:hypothetical protein
MGTFRKESDLQKHAREENNCVLDESYLNPSDEGICPETERRLRDRKGQSSLSENEKWKKTYVITFGVSLDDCPSPCECHGIAAAIFALKQVDFDPNEFEEGRFRRSAADEARQYTDYYRREFRQRIRGPLFDMARRLLTHIAETEVNNRSNSVDSLVIPLEENLVNLLVDVASTVSQLPPSSDTQSERSGVDSISSNITAAPRAPLQPPETMERTALMIGDINLRNNLEDSWASNTRDLTASPFSAFAHPPEVSLQQGPSYLNYVAQASCRSVSEMPSRNNAQYHHGLDDTLSMEYPNTNILESSFYQTTSPHSNSLPENTQSIGENVAKLKSSASSVSAVDGNRRTRALAATKGIESVDDAVFDPGNLITGISSSNDAFTGFELFDTDPNVFEPGDWGNDFIS